MHTELRYGRWKYLSFMLIDIVCLVLANVASLYIYLAIRHLPYSFKAHFSVIVAMVVIDIVVTFVFSTLRRVLRWKKEREFYESARHVFYCLIILGVYLFLTKSGADYSRFIVLTAYSVDFVLICFCRTAWRYVLHRCRRKPEKPTVLLMTTDGFLEEGIERLRELGLDVKYLFLLKNIDRSEVDGIKVIENVKEVASVLCWEMIDRIYIYGLDHQMVPEYLVKSCAEMKLNFDLVDFNYRVIDVKTVQSKDPQYGALSFLEGKRDIPFPIRRVYWITETEADLHRGFHAHRLNCQLLFCPYGKIDVIIDDGEKRTTVALDKPEKGLILMPGLWREIVWRETGSVLCVLASEYYDAKEYIRNYDDFIAYSKKYREVASARRQRKDQRRKEVVPHEGALRKLPSDGESA